MGGGDVFDAEAERFKDGDFVRPCSTRDAPQQDIAELPGDMVAGDGPIRDGQQQIASFHQGRSTVVDDHASSSHRPGIQFTCCRNARTHGVDMAAR